MTRRSTARVAGIAFLLYIAAGITDLVVTRGSSRGDDAAARLTTFAQHATQIRLGAVLTLVEVLCAVALGITLYALSREQDREIALFGAFCRLGEGIVGAASVATSLGLVSVAASATSGGPPDPVTASIGDFLLGMRGHSPTIAAFLFSVGSLAFAWLLLRGRMVPSVLGWLGVVSSLLLVVVLPLHIVKIVGSTSTSLLWIPMAAFEIWLAVLLIARGIPAPEAPAATSRRSG